MSRRCARCSTERHRRNNTTREAVRSRWVWDLEFLALLTQRGGLWIAKAPLALCEGEMLADQL